MPASIRLGRIFGIEIGLHYSWFIIAALIVLSLVGQFTITEPSWARSTIWIMASVTAILFFASIVVHELSHALVARAGDLPVSSITLFALGGVARIDRDAASAGAEFWMAIAGPIASAIIGGICVVSARALGWPTPGASGLAGPVLGWLGYINLALAAFNMIPGYPLDGGRVLRALLWRASGSMERATRQAARVGQAVGLGMIFFGMLRAFSGAGFGGLWIAFIGWFLLQAAQTSYAHVVILDRLRGIHVSDVMIRQPAAVPTHTTLRTVAEDLRHTGARSAAVTRDGEIVGIVTVRDVASVPQEEWNQRIVDEVMHPLERAQTVSSAAPASDAFELIARGNVAEVPVVDRDHLEGMVTRSHLLEVLRTRAELEH